MGTSCGGSRLKVVDVSGSYDQIGGKLGRECRTQIRSMVSECKKRMQLKGRSWQDAVSLASRFVPFSEEYDPDYLEWVEGYSEGSGQSVEDLMVLLCESEKGFCTDVGACGSQTRDDTVLLGHTEDWRESDEKHVTLVRGQPKKGPSFFVMTNGGIELICGMNSSSICFTGNSLYPSDERVGIPKLVLARKMLMARSLPDAMEAALPAGRASSYNTNLAHKSGEMYCVEGSATAHAAIYAVDGYLVHTNHYLDPRMQSYETVFGAEDRSLTDSSGTVFRYNRALRLLRKSLGEVTSETIKSILSDHVNYPRSICSHPRSTDPSYERDKTNFAVIFDLIESKMSVCKGNPCSGRFADFVLD